MLKQRHVLVAVATFVIAPLAYAQGATVNVDVTPEQSAYQSRTDNRIREWIYSNNRQVTDEERHFIGDHWRRAARIWRIRKLAAAAGDAATVARCDAILGRADHLLEIKIGSMRDHAPVRVVYGTPEVEVQTAPPPPQYEVQPPQPAPSQNWVPGYWAWRDSHHVWLRGHWAEPPQGGMVWEQPRWVNHGNRWAFNDGHWRVNAPMVTANVAPPPPIVYEPPPPPAQEMVVVTAPPAPIIEVRPPSPQGAVWIPGYWHWNGQHHVWVGGRWSAARAGYAWEPHHWEHTPAGSYRMVPGHWRH